MTLTREKIFCFRRLRRNRINSFANTDEDVSFLKNHVTVFVIMYLDYYPNIDEIEANLIANNSLNERHELRQKISFMIFLI